MLFEIINNFNKPYNFISSEIKNIILSIKNGENKNIQSINLIISNDEHLNELKKQYFNQDYYTDVIAFNLEDEGNSIDGEIYISMDRIIYNANKYDCNLNDELKRIIVHGTLHLIGYDDATKKEKESMTHLETLYMGMHSKPIIA
tara:strand:+ start:3451 stop:3885 length:435 start_codon:yes stop_codon:yes gene_type:complete